MRVVSSCGCEGGVGGKEGLVEAFVKWWGEEEEILMFGNGMWGLMQFTATFRRV